MNPQDVRTNADRLQVRDDYLAVLRQQEANLQKTANALSVMVQTGQPPVAPTDMRSMNEKLADIERLKPMFRKQLMSLMDGREAEIVLNNLDNGEIQSAVTIFGEISRELKGKYPLGIPAPVFVEFLRRFLKDYNKSIGFLPKSKEERDALDSADAIGSSRRYLEEQQNQIDKEMEGTRLAQDMRNEESAAIVEENQMNELYNEAFDIAADNEIYQVALNLKGNRKGAPSAQNLKVAKRILGFDKLTPDEIFRYTQPTVGELISYFEYDYFRNFGERFTNAERGELGNRDITQLYDLFVELRGGDNLSGTEELVEDVTQLPQTRREIDKRRAAREQGMMASEDRPFLENVRMGQEDIRIPKGKSLARMESESAMESMLGQLERGYEPAALGPNPSVAEITQAVRRGRKTKYATQEEARLASNRQKKESKARNKMRKDIVAQVEQEALLATNEIVRMLEKGQIDNSRARKIIGEIQLRKQDVINQRLIDAGLGGEKIPAYSGAAEFQGLEASKMPYKEEPREFKGLGVKSVVTGAAKHTKNLIVGRGLTKPKKEFADKIDTSISTLPENKSYVPFGKYVLNQRRLNDNKLMIRTMRGGAVAGIPTLAISPVLGGIIKKMVGGALPSYNEMSNLSEDDQNTLYKIFKMSEVDNADLLPAPNKSKEEEEMNKFQILKGQVLAGNDNKELIRDFKVMLLKFIHNGKVPKGQGMEIICDLMAMGY